MNGLNHISYLYDWFWFPTTLWGSRQENPQRKVPNLARQGQEAEKLTLRLLDEYVYFDLEETIGEGGFGKVKRAIHRPTGETVAVKILRIDGY